MNKLREIREAAGLTQAELGEKVGLSQETISFYESGLRLPNINIAKKIARFFKKKVEDVF